MLAAALGVMGWTLADPKLTHELGLQIAAFCFGFFLACMFCHGELVTLKPAPRYLTRFYLMISLGGALGSVAAGVVAPLVFPPTSTSPSRSSRAGCCCCGRRGGKGRCIRRLALSSALFTAIGCACGAWSSSTATPCTSRNFYGVLRVQDVGSQDVDRRRTLVHGTIMHGKQSLHPDFSTEPTTYYTRNFGHRPPARVDAPAHGSDQVGVIGLGTGTLAVYGAKGDVYRFYDINPGVITIAQRDFSFLKDSDATIEIPLGDARLSLEREPPQRFDVLAIDAFSSDAIPVHLITAEALDVYLRHMKPDGVIAFHVTNRFLDLVPVVEGWQRKGLHIAPDRRPRPRRAREPQRLGAARPTIRNRSTDPRLDRIRHGDRAAQRLAAVDRRFQQSGAGTEVARSDLCSRIDRCLREAIPPPADPGPYRALIRPPGARHIEALDQRALPHALVKVEHRRRRSRRARDPPDVDPRRAADRRGRRLWPGAGARPRRERRRVGQGARRARRNAPHRDQPALGAGPRAGGRAALPGARAPMPPGARPTRLPPRTSPSTMPSASTDSRCCAPLRSAAPARSA